MITKEVNSINNIDNKKMSSNSKINFSYEEKLIKNNISVDKLSISKEKGNSLKNNNYDYDSFCEENNKTQKNFNKSNSNKTSNNNRNRNSNLSIEKNKSFNYFYIKF